MHADEMQLQTSTSTTMPYASLRRYTTSLGDCGVLIEAILAASLYKSVAYPNFGEGIVGTLAVFGGPSAMYITKASGMKIRHDQIPLQAETRLTESIERLVQLYEALEKTDEMVKWQQELEAVKSENEPSEN